MYLNKMCAHAIIEMFLATCRFGSSLSISATFFREKISVCLLNICRKIIALVITFLLSL